MIAGFYLGFYVLLRRYCWNITSLLRDAHFSNLSQS